MAAANAIRQTLLGDARSGNSQDGKRSRSRALRLYREGSPAYNGCYKRRQDVESMHRHLKDHFWNGRISNIGEKRLRIAMFDYQTIVNTTALIAWHYRTGGDLTPWFGKLRPPPLKRTPAVAA